MAKKQPPIGFGRRTPDPDPNGTGDGYRWHSGDGDDEPEEKQEGPPPRQPKAAPAFVGQMEAYGILTAYDLFPLGPLSNLELQLIQVVAGLERRIEELSQA